MKPRLPRSKPLPKNNPPKRTGRLLPLGGPFTFQAGMSPATVHAKRRSRHGNAVLFLHGLMVNVTSLQLCGVRASPLPVFSEDAASALRFHDAP